MRTVQKRFTSDGLGGQDDIGEYYYTYAHGAALADIFNFFSPVCRRHFNAAHSSAVSIFWSASRLFFRRKFDGFWSPIRRDYDDVYDGGGGGGGGGGDEANSLRHTSLTIHINKSIVASLVIVIRPALPTDFLS